VTSAAIATSRMIAAVRAPNNLPTSSFVVAGLPLSRRGGHLRAAPPATRCSPPVTSSDQAGRPAPAAAASLDAAYRSRTVARSSFRGPAEVDVVGLEQQVAVWRGDVDVAALDRLQVFGIASR